MLRHLQSRIAALIHDLVMIPFAWVGAYWLRFNLGTIPEQYLDRALILLPVVIVMQGGIFWYMGLYRGVWRFASIADFIRIGKAVVVGVAALAVILFLSTRMQFVPRSVLILYSVLLFGALGVPRLLYRWLKDHKLRAQLGQRTLIIGSGQAAEMLIRDLLRHRDHAYYPVALVDDSRSRQGREIHGVRVVGTLDQIPEVVSKLNLDLMLIAIPSVTAKEMRRVVQICEQTKIPFRTLPAYEDLVSGQVTMQELRDVSIEDLLGRDPVNLDNREVRAATHQQTIIVTGGAGSIGSELCRQIARLNPSKLIVFDKSEFQLYQIEQELKEWVTTAHVELVLGDTCDVAAVDELFRRSAPDLVFHAAAYKHVPMLETNVREAVKNNVIGTANVAAAAKRCGCGTFVFISTDKAVNPTSVMGASKRVAEILCQEASREGPTQFLTVRFGNVLGSAGSVVPLFKKQISKGGPVTVTHAEMTRFFMTITEACQLILQAAALGGSGTIYVLDMGEPIKISYLAEQMIRLSGKNPGEDIELVYTGLRPGEKLYEELFHGEEALSATPHTKIMRAQHRPQSRNGLDQVLTRLGDACEAFDVTAIEGFLTEIVPEFRAGPEVEFEFEDVSKVVPINVKQL